MVIDKFVKFILFISHTSVDNLTENGIYTTRQYSEERS